MSVFLDNARRIFEVARADDHAGDTDFAMLVGADGGLHVIMESPVSLDAVSASSGARAAYRVTRSAAGVKVTGRSFDQDLVLQDRAARRPIPVGLLRDQPLYRMTSPLLTAASEA